MLFKFDQDDGVKYHQQDKGNVQKHDNTCKEVFCICLNDDFISSFRPLQVFGIKV